MLSTISLKDMGDSYNKGQATINTESLRAPMSMPIDLANGYERLSGSLLVSRSFDWVE